MLIMSPNVPVFAVLPGLIECLETWTCRRASSVSKCEGKINKQSLLETDDKEVKRETSECKIDVR